MADDKKNDSIGALWEKSSNKGTYFTGQIEVNGTKVSIVCFKNSYKKEDRHPDYRIFVSVPKENRPSQPEPQKERTYLDENNEDLPFA